MMESMSFVPALEQNKELIFLHAVHMSTYDKIGDIPNIDLSTVPVDVYTDIEVNRYGDNTSSYCLQFDKETLVNSVFIERMKQNGFELSFISMGGYPKDSLKVWFKEVQ